MGEIAFIVWRESVEALLVVGILYAWLRTEPEGRRGLPWRQARGTTPARAETHAGWTATAARPTGATAATDGTRVETRILRFFQTMPGPACSWRREHDRMKP